MVIGLWRISTEVIAIKLKRFIRGILFSGGLKALIGRTLQTRWVVRRGLGRDYCARQKEYQVKDIGR